MLGKTRDGMVTAWMVDGGRGVEGVEREVCCAGAPQWYGMGRVFSKMGTRAHLLKAPSIAVGQRCSLESGNRVAKPARQPG
jgi:hypothetical protein